VDAAPHVIAAAYMDRELALVPEVDAPGVTSCAAAISQQLGGHGIRELPHEEIIAKLDEAARMFRVLIIKTQSTIPYTSVFLELGCGYWAPQAEARLRARIAQMV